MKLIDLLVQELPKRGGWPYGAKHARQDDDGEICFEGGCGCGYDFIVEEMSSDGKAWLDEHNRCISDFYITSEQYEAALAAAQQPVWNGEGLPTVGCECERSWAGDKWLQCKIIFVSDEIVLVKLATREAAYQLSDVKFRPLLSESDKKREAALDAIYGAIASAERAHNRSDEADKVYEAIAAGKVPGVKLSD